MRRKTVHCDVNTRNFIRAKTYSSSKLIELVRPADHLPGMMITPKNARELGKVLVQMADEKEKT